MELEPQPRLILPAGRKAEAGEQSIGIALADSTDDGTVLTFVDLSWNRLDALIDDDSIAIDIDSPLWSVHQHTGRLTLDTDLDMMQHRIFNLPAINTDASTWHITEEGKFVVKEVVAEKGKIDEFEADEGGLRQPNSASAPAVSLRPKSKSYSNLSTRILIRHQ